MRLLIMETYNLRDFQIIGGPAWFKNDQWDIEAVADDGAALLMLNAEDPGRPTAASLMMQSLIENRFQLKFHLDTKELSVYELTAARNGPKFKLSMEHAYWSGNNRTYSFSKSYACPPAREIGQGKQGSIALLARLVSCTA